MIQDPPFLAGRANLSVGGLPNRVTAKLLLQKVFEDNRAVVAPQYRPVRVTAHPAHDARTVQSLAVPRSFALKY